MNTAGFYRIKVRGIIPANWIDRLGGLRIAQASSAQSTLEGWLPDEAALKGVLDSLYYLRLSLDEVKRTPCEISSE